MSASINGSINGSSNTRTAAQQAELNKMRKAKAINIDPPAASPEVLFEAQQEQSYFNTLMDTARAAGILVPTWKRGLLAFVAATCAGLAVASLLHPFVSAMFAGAMITTGSVFLSYLFMALGFVIALYLSAKTAQKVGNYIATGDIDRDIAKVWNKAKGLFGSGEIVRA